jgi:hypothetical protein
MAMDSEESTARKMSERTSAEPRRRRMVIHEDGFISSPDVA